MSQTPQQPERKDEQKKPDPSTGESFRAAFGLTDIFEGLFKGIGWILRGIVGIIFLPFKLIFDLFD